MTIPYSNEIATNSPVAFLRLLFRWEGSVYKYIWSEFIMFIGLYTIISVTYRFIMTDLMKRHLEYISIYCETIGILFPIGFVLGFFVDLIVSRWWKQYNSLPWPDELAMLINAYAHGDSDKIRLQLRTLLRYANLSYCLALRDISSRVRKRYPTKQHLVSLGLMTQEELNIYLEEVPKGFVAHYSTPIFWAMDLLNTLHEDKTIPSNRSVELITKEFQKIRSGLADLLAYDWINTPLVYTQVATLTVYGYFISTLFAWQFLNPLQKLPKNTIDLWVPFFEILQFIFYMGWLKVAESLINPFGEDPDDFEMDDIIERNLQFSKFAIDNFYGETPNLSRGIILETEDDDASKKQTCVQSTNEMFAGSLLNLNVGLSKPRHRLFSSGKNSSVSPYRKEGFIINNEDCKYFMQN